MSILEDDPDWWLRPVDCGPGARKHAKRLEQIKAEIRTADEEISQKHSLATKIMCGAIYKANLIGQLLLEVKELVGHGHYEAWVEEHFDGEMSTARAYTRIARNWAHIDSEMALWGGMSIEQALALLRPRGPETEPKRKKPLDRLVKQFRILVKSWPTHAIKRLADDEFEFFMQRIQQLAMKRNNEMVQEEREEYEKELAQGKAA